MGGRGRVHPRIAKHIPHACAARRPRFHSLTPWDTRTGNAWKHVLPDTDVNAVLRRTLPDDEPATSRVPDVLVRAGERGAYRRGHPTPRATPTGGPWEEEADVE